MRYVGQHRAPRPLLQRPAAAVLLAAVVLGGPTFVLTNVLGGSSEGATRPHGATIAPIPDSVTNQGTGEWTEDTSVDLPPLDDSPPPLTPDTADAATAPTAAASPEAPRQTVVTTRRYLTTPVVRPRRPSVPTTRTTTRTTITTHRTTAPPTTKPAPQPTEDPPTTAPTPPEDPPTTAPEEGSE